MLALLTPALTLVSGSKTARYALLALLLALAGAAGVMWISSRARQDGKAQAEVSALKESVETMEKVGEETARARADGAERRLLDGTF